MFVSAILRMTGMQVIDNRGCGTCLWVVPDGEDFAPVQQALTKVGVRFHYCPNSRIVRKRFGKDMPAWWTDYNKGPEEQFPAVRKLFHDLFAMKPIQLQQLPPAQPQRPAQEPSHDSCGVFELCSDQESEKSEVRQDCSTCAYNFDCNESWGNYAVGCERYIMSYKYKYGNYCN